MLFKLEHYFNNISEQVIFSNCVNQTFKKYLLPIQLVDRSINICKTFYLNNFNPTTNFFTNFMQIIYIIILLNIKKNYFIIHKRIFIHVN